MKERTHRGAYLLIPVLAIPVLSAHSAEPDYTMKHESRCKFTIENPASCHVEVGGDNASVMPAIRMSSKTDVEVEIRVHRKPLEIVEIDATTTFQADPDLGLAILKQFIDPLKSLVFDTKTTFITPAVRNGVLQSLRTQDPTITFLNCTEFYESICKVLVDVRHEQAAISATLDAWATGVSGAETSLKALKSVTAWTNPPTKLVDANEVDTAVNQLLTTARRDLGVEPAPQELPCSSAGAHVVRCTLPSTALATQRERLITARQIFAGQPAKGDELYLKTLSEIAVLMDYQLTLEAALTATRSTQEKLIALSDKLSDVKPNRDLRPFAVSRVKSPGGTANTAAKVTKTNLWSGKSVTPGIPTIQWQDQSWEVSTGIGVSFLKKRSFGVAPTLDASGTPTGSSQITRSTTNPNVIPMVFVSRRYAPEELRGTTRTARFFSGGIGVNDGSAEAFVGWSYSYGSFVGSVGGHIGRKRKLGHGLDVGDTTTIAAGDISKFEKKKWVMRPALALSYRLPIP